MDGNVTIPINISCTFIPEKCISICHLRKLTMWEFKKILIELVHIFSLFWVLGLTQISIILGCDGYTDSKGRERGLQAVRVGVEALRSIPIHSTISYSSFMCPCGPGWGCKGPGCMCQGQPLGLSTLAVLHLMDSDQEWQHLGQPGCTTAWGLGSPLQGESSSTIYCNRLCQYIVLFYLNHKYQEKSLVFCK